MAVTARTGMNNFWAILTATASAIMSGVCLTLLGRLLLTRDKRAEGSAQVRVKELDVASTTLSEVLTECRSLRADVDRLQGELDHWKGEYWKLRAENEALKQRVAELENLTGSGSSVRSKKE